MQLIKLLHQQSLVSICPENYRQLTISLFPDHPRFFIKNANFLGWSATNMENWEHFYFPITFQTSEMHSMIVWDLNDT